MTDPALWLAVLVGLVLGWLTRLLPRTWPRRRITLNQVCAWCGKPYDALSRPHGSQLAACSEECAPHIVGPAYCCDRWTVLVKRDA